MAWLRRGNKEESDICTECLQEAIDQGIVGIQRARYIEKLPCGVHGHPGILPPQLQAWWDFFRVVYPYSTPQTLDHVLIGRICDEKGISFCMALEKLTTLLKAVGKNHGKPKRTKSPPKDESEGG